MNANHRVVVTGMGMVTALGLDVQTTWECALAGKSGLRRLDLPEWLGAPIVNGGSVSDEDFERIRREFSDIGGERRTAFALWAAEQAVKDSTIRPDRCRLGVVMGTGAGVARMEDVVRYLAVDGNADWVRFGAHVCQHDGTQSACPLHPASQIRWATDDPARRIARKYSAMGPCLTVTTACASATQAIGLASRMIRRGDVDAVLCGGADSMFHPVGLVFFVLLGAASTEACEPAEACRPFDRKRAGLVMGEGAGILVLESEAHARKRGARVYARVAGYASSMDAWQPTAPHPQGEGAVRAMRGALCEAGLTPEDVDYINAHGTGTKLNDAAETSAIHTVFGDHASQLCVSSSKPLLGHLLAACGGPECILTVLSVNSGKIHPTLNRRNPDPKCDLDYVCEGARVGTVRAALSNSFGFGGTNGCLVIVP